MLLSIQIFPSNWLHTFLGHCRWIWKVMFEGHMKHIWRYAYMVKFVSLICRCTGKVWSEFDSKIFPCKYTFTKKSLKIPNFKVIYKLHYILLSKEDIPFFWLWISYKKFHYHEITPILSKFKQSYKSYIIKIHVGWIFFKELQVIQNIFNLHIN